MSTKNLHFTGWREIRIQRVQVHSLAPSEVWCHPKDNTKNDALFIYLFTYYYGFGDNLSHVGCGLVG